MAEPLWKFDGYATANGRTVVRDWFLGDLTDDERDSIRDRIRYLRILPKVSWMEPHFKNFGKDFGEIRDNSERGAIRIYGQFTSTDRFLMLAGCIKKKNKDRDGLEKANLRLKEFNKKNGSAIEFDIEEEPSKPNQAKQGNAIEAGSEEFGAGDCVSN